MKIYHMIVGVRTFRFPVELESIEEWIEELEALCDEAWHEANGWEDD